MAQRNILEVAPLQSYNQTLNYYNRVKNDSGTLIVPYDVDRIYHSLNLLSLQNRSYKLYHASAGLQKTSEQIDKLYDLGKNDVDQTFSGSDRPETNAIRNENEMSVEKTSTNYLDYTGADLSSLENASKCDYVKKTTNYLNSNWDSWEIGLQSDVAISDVSYTGFSLSNNYQSSEAVYAIVEFVSGSPEVVLRGRSGNDTTFDAVFDFDSVSYTSPYGWSAFSANYEKLLSAGHGLTENDGDIYRFWAIINVSSGDVGSSKDIWLEHETPLNEGGVYVLHFVQNEALEIFTSPIEGHTTRTAPEPVFENFLPHADASQPLSFFLWTQDLFVRPDAGLLYQPYIFSLEGGGISHRLFYIGSPTEALFLTFGNVAIKIFGEGDLVNYSRKIKFFFFSQDGNSLKAYLGDSEGNLIKRDKESYDANNQTIPSRNLGLGVRLRASRIQTNVQGYALGSFSQHFSDEEVKKLYEGTGKSVIGADFQMKTYTDES